MKKVLVLLFLLCLAVPLQAQTRKWVHVDRIPVDSESLVIIPPLSDMGQYPQPVIYQKWWSEVMLCSGKSIPMTLAEQVKFFWVRSDGFLIPGDTTVLAGITMPWVNSIVITMDLTISEPTVKHEMLHFVLWQNGIPGHPYSNNYFRKCKLPEG